MGLTPSLLVTDKYCLLLVFSFPRNRNLRQAKARVLRKATALEETINITGFNLSMSYAVHQERNAQSVSSHYDAMHATMRVAAAVSFSVDISTQELFLMVINRLTPGQAEQYMGRYLCACNRWALYRQHDLLNLHNRCNDAAAVESARAVADIHGEDRALHRALSSVAGLAQQFRSLISEELQSIAAWAAAQQHRAAFIRTAAPALLQLAEEHRSSPPGDTMLPLRRAAQLEAAQQERLQQQLNQQEDNWANWEAPAEDPEQVVAAAAAPQQQEPAANEMGNGLANF